MPKQYPPFPPGPHHPQYPFDPRMWYTDVEPAYEKYAECECHMPPIPDRCVCVTEEDANNWNGAYSAMSAVSAGLDIEAIQSAAELLTSADAWNQAHDVVSAGSATWNTLPAVQSAFASSAEYLQWLIQQTSAVHHDITLTGDGSKEAPLGVEYSEQIDQLIEQYQQLIADSPDFEKWWEAFNECADQVKTYVKELSAGHIQNYELILQILGKTSGAANMPTHWIRDQRMKSIDVNTYKRNNQAETIYYSTYEGA